MSLFYHSDQHVISKMETSYENKMASYFIDKEKKIEIKTGSFVQIEHTGFYQCVSCSKKLKKSYSGFCYPCLTGKAMADTCVMSPHRCHYLSGTCREPAWGESFCFQPHYLYLSYTDKFKVGITRHNQVPYRFIDQGATKAAVLAAVSSRYQSGMLEKAMTTILSDKSHWQNMLKNGNRAPSDQEFNDKWTEVSLWIQNQVTQQPQLIVPTAPHLHLSLGIEWKSTPDIISIEYPLGQQKSSELWSQQQEWIIDKVKSVPLEKQNKISGKILGIKGQYLIFEDGVLNMRSHEGSVVCIQLTKID